MARRLSRSRAPRPGVTCDPASADGACMSHFRSIHRAAGGDHAADHRARDCRAPSPINSCRSRRCRRWISRRSQVSAALPGASPETMASSVATPLERQFGRIAGVNEMTSSARSAATSITLQFDLSRNIDAAARDVQAAINAARGQLALQPCRTIRCWRKINPADSPILMLALTSDTMTPRPDVRCRHHHSAAEALADERRRPGLHRRRRRCRRFAWMSIPRC